MVNWSLQPDEVVEVPEVVDEAESTTEVIEDTEPTPDPMEEVVKRITSLEEANKRADAIANDLRRSVGRAQSIVDRIEKASGSTKVELERLLDERLGEVSTILEDVAGNIDDAILPPQVKEKVRSARAQAVQRAAAVDIDRLVAEKIAAMLPQPPAATNEIPADWRAFEMVMEKQIRDAGLDPDDAATFNWQYAGSLLAQGNRAGAEKYFADILEPHTAGAKLQNKKETAAPSATGTSAVAASKDWWDRLADPKVSMDEKLKIMKDQKLV